MNASKASDDKHRVAGIEIGVEWILPPRTRLHRVGLRISLPLRSLFLVSN